jgi:ElaB/YqjD/DUF883 family membrane-anchored ribosome-binding protein
MTDQRTDLENLRRQADDPTEEQIIAEIEVTRTEMSGTIDEIGNRLSPQVIAEQAREQIREATVGRVERVVQDAGDTAQQTGNTIIGTIRQNPLPATLAAIGIGWLAMRMRDNAGQYRRDGDRRAERGWYAHDDALGQRRFGVRQHYVPSAADSSSDRGREIADRGRELGDQARHAAEDISDQAQEAWHDVQAQAQDQADNVQRQFDRTLAENPLALGALAVGVGAAVGLAIPASERERELMGEQRDRLISQAEQAATDALDQVERTATEAAGKMRRESKSTT